MNRADAMARSHHELLAAIDEVLEALRKPPPLADEAVHSIRKAIKKARAALRLLREGLDESVYREENAALRDAGRYFSPLRDLKSRMDAFDAFRDRHPAQLRQPRYDALSLQLHARLASLRRELSQPAKLNGCVRLLRAFRAGVKRWDLSGSRPSVIGGLRRIHRTGRKTLSHAMREQTPEASHEWRKQVKYLSNALKILDVSDRPRLAKTEERAAKLADRLGDDHDLAELARYVAGDVRVALDADARETLAKLIQRQREKLHKRAFALGAKIYKEKPRRFAARLR
jgi:hypothetical protein